MDAICIDFSREYAKPLVELANKRFGKNYTNEPKLLNHINSEKSISSLVVDSKNNDLLGYAVFFDETLDEAASALKLLPEEIIRVCGGESENVCHMKSIALKENCEKRGVGLKVFTETMNKAKSRNLRSGLCPAWRRKDKVPLKNILLKSGFEYYKTVPLLWIDDEEYECIDCKGPCRCNGEIYYKKLI